MAPQTALLALAVIGCLCSPTNDAQAGPRVAPLIVDIDCDGKPDKVSLSQSTESAKVRVIFGNRLHKPATFSFNASRGRPDAFCTLPVRVQAESLDYDPSEAVGKIPGFQRSKTCLAFALADDQCDSLHFYWNHKTKKLEWWRA